jgi:hypothetical protein
MVSTVAAALATASPASATYTSQRCLASSVAGVTGKISVQRLARQQVDDLEQHPASQPSPHQACCGSAGQPLDRVFGRHSTEIEVQVTGVGAGSWCPFWVTGPPRQDVAADGLRIAAGQPAAWYSAPVPFQAASVRGFAVTAGGKILVTVQACDRRD